jgi:hypothetical protein
MKLRRFFFPLVFLFATTGFLFGGTIESTFFQPIIQSSQLNQSGEQGNPSYAANEGVEQECDKRAFYNRLGCDPVSYYTRWLAWVTTGLFVGTAILAVFTYLLWASTSKLASDGAKAGRKQLRITRAAAEAAKKSADAAVAAERANFFIVIEGDNFSEMLQLAKMYENSPDMMSDVKGRINFSFKNYGKTPGILKEFRIGKMIASRKPPVAPMVFDGLGMPFTEAMIASGDSTNSLSDELLDNLSVAELTPILNGHSYIWFFGMVDYADVFGQPHCHRYLIRYVHTLKLSRFQFYDYEFYNESY